MSWSQFGITTCALLIIGLALFASPVLGQEASLPVLVPRAEETAPGRPTLSLRQPIPRNSSSPSVRAQQPPEKEGGKEAIPSNVASEPKVHFEGLHAFTVADALKLF